MEVNGECVPHVCPTSRTVERYVEIIGNTLGIQKHDKSSHLERVSILLLGVGIARHRTPRRTVGSTASHANSVREVACGYWVCICLSVKSSFLKASVE